MSDVTTYQDALKKASSTIKQLITENERLKRRESIAIIGLGCRLPGGANSPEEYWRLLAEGRDAISPIPAKRWSAGHYFSHDQDSPGRMYVREGGFLDFYPYDFDAPFFGISPKEAKSLDPQQRLLLETAWEALEDAGINPASLQGSRTGVFIGISSNDYDSAHLRSGDPSLIDPYSLTGFTFSTAAGRISYFLGLEGPNFPVDTACSSSLVALHLACRSLRNRECQMALVGGVNLMLTPEPLIAFCKLRALSPDGRCKTFDADANGYGRGEGCGMIVLKRMDAAEKDGDRILAVIRGSALNSDGRSNGLTAPNGMAQRRVIRAALEDAALMPGDIDYLEAHGTGTSLGDPIEIEAIAAVLGQGRDPDHPLLVGSVKTNIGHLEAAAGIAGVIKLVLALNHEKIPSHLHFNTPNPHVAWDRLPLSIVSGGASWSRSSRPRRAGISCFGFSGTNAHAILEEAPLNAFPPADGRTSHLLAISAAGEVALRSLAGRYATYLQGPALPPLAAICHTAASGRNTFSHGLAVVGNTSTELAERLSAFVEQGTTKGIYLRSSQSREKPSPVFLFTGQGSQYPGMGRELYATSPVYREALDRCDSLFAPLIGLSIRDLMHGDSEEQLACTIYAQPAIFSLEYSLACLWSSWGVRPSAVVGHSIGEFVAACLAGVLALEDAVTLVAHRGRLMNALPAGGVMAAVRCSEAAILPALAPHAGRVSLAVVNSPGSVVISGDRVGVAGVLETLQQQGFSSQYLNVSHAFHSPLMDPVLEEFEGIAASLTFHEPTLTVISNVTGKPAVGDDLRTASYWRRHLRGSVRFSESVEFLNKQGHDLFLEVGATATLSSFVRQIAGADCRLVASLKRRVPPWSTLMAALGDLFAAGVAIDWQGFDAPYRAGRVSLPTYPFQRERYIMDPVHEPGGRGTAKGISLMGEEHPLLGRRMDAPSVEKRFVGALGTTDDPWLAGHVIHGAVIVPAAAYLEMALASAVPQFLPAAPLLLEKARFAMPLLLTEERKSLQTIHRPDTGAVEVFSLASQGQWQLHASLTVRPLSGQKVSYPPLQGSLAPQFPAAGGEKEEGMSSVARQALAGKEKSNDEGGIAVDGDRYYSDLLEKGYCYTGVFRSIRRLRFCGAHISGDVEIPQEAAAGFVMHPALLDGCLTLTGASFLYGPEPLPDAVAFVPAEIDSLLFSGAQASCLQVRCVQQERSQASARFDLIATDRDGAPVLQITGLTLRRIRKEQMLSRSTTVLSDLMYQVLWRECAPAAPASSLSGRWVALTDPSPCAAALSEVLKGCGVSLTEVVKAGSEGGKEGRIAVDPFSPEDMESLALDLRNSPEPVAGLVSFWGEDLTGNLNLVKGLLAAKISVPLFLVTAGVHNPSGMDRENRPEGAPLWGFGATVAAEHPELSCRLLDLSPWPGKDEGAQFVNELAVRDGEDRVALRGRRRFVPRLCRAESQELSKGMILPKKDGFYIDVDQRGSLEGLCVRTRGRVAPEPGEVEVQVRAVGLNFRDVLNVLGQYPGDPGIPGFECSGMVTRVGRKVEGVAPGERVFVFNTDGCIADFLTVSAAHVAKVPTLWRFEEAAAIPVAFLTAWYGLHQRACLKKDDRVLIHAAAGGVGLAAVQLCQAAGARVFATAGSPEKRELLRRLGVEWVMDSRSLAFADQVKTFTSGRGVDIVLNSLAGEFIDQSLGLLAAGGRFVELGKADSRSEQEIAALYPHVAYHRFDLAALMAADPALAASLFDPLHALFEQGVLRPLPMTVFQVHRVADAFRFMAQARHIGKVIVSFADRCRERLIAERGVVDPDASYLITGGLGVLGMTVAHWLIEEGCRHLVLMGRRAPSAATAPLVERLRRPGVQVAVMTGDAAEPGDVDRMMSELHQAWPPLKGVFHAAGLLDDALLMDLDDEHLKRVMAPKIAAAWNLHRATENCDLELFVLFSSLTAVTGSPGQANYAAANAALDGFARWRRSRGLAAVSVNWGPWAGSGMAAREGVDERLAARGIRSMDAATGVQALAAVLQNNREVQCVADLDIQRLTSFMPDAGAGLYAELLSQPGQGTAEATRAPILLDRLKAAGPEEQPAVMLSLIQELAAKVMGQGDPRRIECDRPLQEQGFDSLMAVDLRNLIARTFSVDLPVSLLFDYPTPEKIGRFLLHDVLALGEKGKPLAMARVAVEVAEKTADDLVAEIEQLLGKEG